MTTLLRTRHAWTRLLTWTAGLAVLLTVATVQPASAAPAPIGQAPPEWSWVQLEDSHGISVWHYELALDRGGVLDPGKFVWSFVVDQCWGLYWTTVASAIWFLDWVLSFDWVKLIAEPLLAIGDALHTTLNDLGLVPTFLMAAALLAVLWMTRGKWATGVWELAVTLLVAALATGALASPVHLVADPDTGYLYKARDAGFEIAAALATGHADHDATTAPAMRKALTGQLATTFIRQPAQIINFGQVLDGGKCESAYTDVTKGGPYGFESDIRDKVASCDSALGTYADNPSASMATGALVFMPAAGVILLLGIVIAGSVLLAGVNVLWQSLKLVVNLVTGLLPGGTRGSLLLTLSEAVMSLLMLAFTTVFLAVFMELVQVLFREAKGTEIPKTFITTDIVLILGVLTYLKTRRRINEAAHRLAQFLAQRPGEGAKPTRIPEPTSSGAARTAGKALAAGATLLYLRRRGAGNGGSSPGTPPPLPEQPTSRTVFSGVGQPPAAAGGSGPGSPSAPGGSTSSPLPGSGGSGGLSRVTARSLATAGLRLGARAALSYATGGSSTLASAALTASRAQRAAQLLGSPRRRALTGRLALPAAPPPSASGRRIVAPLPPAPARPALPAGPTAPGRSGRTGRPPGYDRIVRDGQIVMVPRVSQASTRTPGAPPSLKPKTTSPPRATPASSAPGAPPSRPPSAPPPPKPATPPAKPSLPPKPSPPSTPRPTPTSFAPGAPAPRPPAVPGSRPTSRPPRSGSRPDPRRRRR